MTDRVNSLIALYVVTIVGIFIFTIMNLHISVNVGLKVKLQGEKEPHVWFTYAFTPFMDEAIKMDWKCIAIEDVQSQHIRCHELQPGDNVQELFHRFKKAHSKALVLINTQNNYSVDSEFVKEIERGRYPIIVVTKDDGTALIRLIDAHVDQVEARLDAISMIKNSKEEEYDIVKESEIPVHKQDSPLDQQSKWSVIKFTTCK